MRTAAFHGRLRNALVGWIGVGATLAATTSVLAFVRVGTRDGLIYAVIAVVLSMAATAVARGVRWVTGTALVVCAGQIGAVVGLVAELVNGIASSKAVDLRALGFAPVVGVSINLVLSGAASALFIWFLFRWLHLRRLTRMSNRDL